MLNTIRYAILLSLMVFYSTNSFASHAAGMDISYECISSGATSDVYKITVKFYRDCNGNAGVYYGGSISYSSSCGSGSTTLSQVGNPVDLNPQCATYCNGGTVYGVQEFTFSGNITLNHCSDWVLSVCENARNAAINTINNPGLQDLCVEATLNNTVYCNNSPTFSQYPTPFICANNLFCYNNGAIEIDGDLLVYSLVTPLNNANGGTVTYIAPYSASNPVGGTTTFDPVTGNLCVNAPSQLNGILAIKVSEYRNGVLIGSVIRDIQIGVFVCAAVNPPLLTGIDTTTVVDINDTNSYVVDVNCPNGSQNISFNINTINNNPSGTPGVEITVSVGGGSWDSEISWEIYDPSGAGAGTIIASGGAPYSGTVCIPNINLGSLQFRMYDSWGDGWNGATYTLSGNSTLSGQTTGGLTGWTSYGVNTFNVTGGTPCTSGGASVTMSWNNGIPGATFTISNNNTMNPTGTFSWNPTLADTANSPYFFTVSVDNQACPAPGSFSFQYQVTIIGTDMVATPTITNVNCNGGNDGIISVSTTGSLPPFTYLWFNGSSSTVANNMSAGTYNLQLSDSGGCTMYETYTVIEPSQITSTSTFYDASCLNINDGSATVFPTGGTPGYTYLWNDSINQTTQTATNLAGGIYICTITDTNNCDFTDTVNVGFSPTYTTSVLSTNPTCNNNYGTAIVSVQAPSSGISNLTYCTSTPGSNTNSTIDNVQLIGDTFNITNNTTGICDQYEDYTNQYADITQGQSYTIDITLGDCSSNYPSGGKVYIDWNIDGDFFDIGEEIGTIPIGPPSTTTISFTVPFSVFGATRMRIVSQFLNNIPVSSIGPCDVGVMANPIYIQPWFGATEDYSIVVNGGSVNATYLWSNGQTTDSIFGLSPGTYTVTVTDPVGCVTIDTAIITGVFPLTVTTSVVDVSCAGLTDGSVTLNISGGTPNYTINAFSFSQTLLGGVSTFTTPPIIPAGNYPYSINDINGCLSSGTVTILEPPPSTGIDNVGAHCVSYTWIDGITYTASNNTATDTIQSSNGCDSVVTLNLIINSSPIVMASATPSTICVGYPTTLTGSGANTYSWNMGVTDGVAFNPTTTTTYTVTGTDMNGCVNTDMITVNVNQLPTVVANANPATICIGDQTTLSGSGASTYSWDNGVTNGITFNPTTTTTYTLTGTDVNGCINTDMITVNVNQLPTVVANANPATICIGDQTTLSGSGASTYSWDNGVTNGITFNPTTTTTYTVTGTDVNGCVGSNQVIVTVNSIPAASLAGVDSICIGNSATLNFNLIGNAPFTVDFTDGTNNFISILDNNGNLLAGDAITFSPTSNTTYNITSVSDVNACSNTASGSEIIIVNPLPTASISGATTICAGNNTALSFSLNGFPPFNLNYTDGTNNFSVVLDSNGNTLSGPLLVSPTANTTYTLLDITDNNTCFNTLTDTTMISVMQTSSAGNNTTATFCANDPACDMWALLGGSPAVGGIWMNSVGNTVSNLFDPATSTAGTYTYTVSAAPCPSTNADLIVNINSIPTINISGTDTICIGEFSDLSFTLTGLAPFNVNYTDGTNNFNVNLDANGNNVLSGFPISHYPLINTNYSIIGITDANGCNNTGNGIAEKIVNPLPNISIDGTVGICLGDSTDISFSVWEGAAPFNVTLNDGTADSYWLMDSNGTVNGLPVTISPNNTTTYSLVEATDANGCWNALSGNATITIYALPTALISGTTTICEDENTPIAFTLQNGLTPYNVNYTINSIATNTLFNISGFNTIMVSPTTTTTYKLVDITDANNCYNTASDSATIDVNEKVDAIISGGGDICNDGSQATIDINMNDSTIVNVTYTNGFMPTTLSGIGPFKIITNQAGFYMITSVVDIHGCEGDYSGNATITVNPLPLAEFGFYPQPTDLNNPHINFTNASFGHTTSIWDFGDGTILNDTISKILHTYQDTGHYKVTLAVSNEFGCTDSIAYTIIIDPIFIIYIPDAFTPNGDGINDAFGPSVYGIKEFEMKIYDRWGQIIYQTTDEHKPWDGAINNNQTQSGVYTYSIVATDQKDKPHKFVGAFTLFR